MGRAKLSREFIENEKKRNTSFRQKKRTLIKKACEFSILCDVPVCVIVFPFVGGNKKIVQPEIFSYKGEQKDQENVNSDDSTTNNPELGREIINRYLAVPKEIKKNKRSLNLSDVLKDVNEKRLISVDQDLYNIMQKNHTNLSEFTNDQLIALLGKLDHKIDSVKSRIDVIKNVSNNGFDAEQQEIKVLDDEEFLSSDFDLDFDFDGMLDDLKGPTGPNYEGIYNMDMKGVTPNYTEIDQGSGFADNYLLQCIPMLGTTPSSNTDINQGSRFADNYPLQCVPMMGTTSTSYTDNNQGSSYADYYPLQRNPIMGHSTYNSELRPQFADNYPLQCIPVMDRSIYNDDLGQRFADNYSLQRGYPMMGRNYCNEGLGFTDNLVLKCNPMYYDQKPGFVANVSAMQSDLSCYTV